MVMKRLHIIVALTLTIILGIACQKNVPKDRGNSEPASLTFNVTLPNIGISTKARELFSDADNGDPIVSDPFGTDLSKWTEFEKLIDGRVIYRLTMFLVDKVDGVLVGYRDLYYKGYDKSEDSEDITGEGKREECGVNGLSKDSLQATITFNYDHPVHILKDGSSLEKLERGKYRMIVVANWSSVNMKVKDNDNKDGDYSYKGLKGRKPTDGEAPEFETYVKNIIAKYNAQNGDKPLRFSRTVSSSESDYGDDYHNLMDFAMYSCDTHFLCPLEPMPLVLVKDFELHPGKNEVSGQLIRTRARLRIAIENVSNDVLTVHNLQFGANTTRNESFLFYAPGNEQGTLSDPSPESNGGTTKYGSPTINKDDGLNSDHDATYNALVSFKPNTEVPSLKSNNRKVLFDGYILDGNGQGNLFTYDVDFEYEGKLVKNLARARDNGSWVKIESDPSAIEDGGLYVIQNQESSKRILYAGDGQVETALLTNDGHGVFTDDVKYFEPDQVFRFIAEKDSDGKTKTETVTNRYTDKAGKEEAYPIFSIQTYDGKYWIGTPQNGYATNLALESIESNRTPFVVRNDGYRKSHPELNYLCFYSTKPDSQNKTRYFINVNGDTNFQHQVNGWSDNDGGSEFYLHKVVVEEDRAQYSGTVTLSTLDPVTAVVSPVTSIRRNDFINILITVSYNEKAGEMQFVVKDWNEIDNNIDFD